MNAFLLVIPIILLRYPFMSFISKNTADRAGFFPPTEGEERIAFYIYQLTTISLMIYLFFLEIKLDTLFNYIGLFIYTVGAYLYMKSIIDFSKPKANGININGLYKLSRNPMYVAFFFYFLGISLLVVSWVYFIILMVFQLSVHYLILSEERWCVTTFGVEYKEYMRQVRRYI